MNPTLSRRAALCLAATVAAAASGLASAQPAKPVKLIVPFPAGGTADVLPRILTEKVRAAYPAGIVVENKAGAGGNIGAELVARGDSDGTTFLVSPPGPIAINHYLYKSLNFDPTKWVPVTVIATVPNVLAVSNKLPARTVAELVAYARANPDKVSYASQGNGSTSHLTASMFMQQTGVKMVHVPYKGTAPALVDLLAGNVDVFFDNISSSAQHHTAGKIRILAVADDERSPLLPQVPTLKQAGVDMEAVTFFTMVAPPNTPKDAIAYAHKQFSTALAAPDVKQKFFEQGAVPGGWSPEKTAQFIRAESERWGKVVKAANVTVE
ncbi:Bug family tripartite tricarboxylate transporter substrate binding protein [Ramlibacter albus]|uniref:Tripartite tricarboxylate transporter substrate binding protein n=1 Tax=Ramlibacter albus TaxID=2079448 RepID=A0A923S0A4_9BURK|nr:tripartite tricarboxylate transporter substrate binding protein [Ramlibacter albus]MBC5763055.1 tripartite tricarboxylate transporter substrate binding protein [Ramlibacter albus]